MFRLSLTTPPTTWFPARVPVDGAIVEVPVRFRLLDTDQAAQETARRLRLISAIQADTPDTHEMILAELDPAELARMRDLLAQHILDWDIEDADTGHRVPVNAETLAVVLRMVQFLRPLWTALLDASTEVGLKKTSSTGSTGTPTPDPAPSAGGQPDPEPHTGPAPATATAV
jgi:hypothetical protein